MKKWLMVFGVGAMVLTLGFVAVGGPARAQDSQSETAAEQSLKDQFKESLAANLGVTVEELELALEQTRIEMIDVRAEAAKDRVLSGEGRSPGHRRGMNSGIRIPFEGFQNFGGQAERLDEMALFLGVEPALLEDSFRDGMTLAEIAEANGKTVDELRAYLIAQATDAIDARLAVSPDGDEANSASSPAGVTSTI